MRNEFLLIANLIFVYSGVLFFYHYFKKTGLYVFSAIVTIIANIEALALINGFGMEQTLGNVLFASTFLITDILSEIYGKEESYLAVKLSIAVSVVFIVLSQFWLYYIPSVNDTMFPSMRNIFTHTPRLVAASFFVYAVSQTFDVWAYHKWWSFTEKLTHKRESLLWVRNNGSTLISQLINTILFTLCAFWGVYDNATLASIICSSYVIYIFTSLADTPVVYLARFLSKSDKTRI